MSFGRDTGLRRDRGLGLPLGWLGLCCVMALGAAGCQRVPSDGNDNAPPDSGGAGNLDEEGGGTFLEGGQGGDENADEGDEPAQCSVVDQTGCDAGQKCTVTSIGGSVEATCVLDPPEHDAFAGCTPSLTTGIDGCPAGYACLGSDGAGLCLELCVNDNSCDGGLCVVDPLDRVSRCADACSPFQPGCVEPLQCRRRDDQYGCVFAGDEDIGGAGAPCILEGDTGCATGFACIAGALLTDCGEDRCCTSLCDLASPDTCPGGATCVPALDAPGPGAENVGACFVPS